MPSPLSGLTQPAASPISAQLGPATCETAPPIGSRAEVGRAQVAGELELLAALVGVEAHQRLDRDVGRPLGGGQGADADVHLAGAEREDPAVAGQDLAVLAAQLEVRADPRVVGHPGGDVGAAGDAVDGVAVPLAAEHLAQRRADAVGDHEPAAGDLEASAVAAPLEDDGRDPVALAAYVDRARAPSTAVAPDLIAVVRRWSSSSVRATARAPVGQRCRRARAAAASGRSRARAGPG